MTDSWSRRRFLKASLAGAAALGEVLPLFAVSDDGGFQISLSELSFCRALSSGRMDHLDLAHAARTQFDIAAVEYAGRFFRERVGDEKYLMEMNKRAADEDVRQLFIVVDGEGSLGDPDANLRKKAVLNHHRWVDAAEVLGCHSIEVDVASTSKLEDRLDCFADGIGAVCQYAEQHHINVLVGCREGQPGDAGWLLHVIRQVKHPSCGALPTFAMLATPETERDVAGLLSLAKGICAAARDFDADRRETQVDFFRVASAILTAGYRGYVGIAYQGETLRELDGIRATKTLLETARSAAKSQ